MNNILNELIQQQDYLEALDMPQNSSRPPITQPQDPGALGSVSIDRTAYYIIKRVTDILLSSALLLALMPLMLIIAALIYVYSPGPVFFSQKRVGAKRIKRNGRTYWQQHEFNFYKFRTMKLHADSSIHQEFIKALIQNDQQRMDALQGSAGAPAHKLVNDPRILAPGRILRKLSLDELPQLWNVILGDMSLVGPRPAIPYEVELYKPWHMQRLQAQPGISGLQQVTARCMTDFDRQVLLDLDYIAHQSFWLDLKIIIKTPLAIFSATGAY